MCRKKKKSRGEERVAELEGRPDAVPKQEPSMHKLALVPQLLH